MIIWGFLNEGASNEIASRQVGLRDAKNNGGFLGIFGLGFSIFGGISWYIDVYRWYIVMIHD